MEKTSRWRKRRHGRLKARSWEGGEYGQNNAIFERNDLMKLNILYNEYMLPK